MGELGPVEARCDFWELTVPYQERERLVGLFPGGCQVRKNRQGDLRGWRGYDHSADLAVGSGLVGWRPDRQDMGCHVSLGSQALDLLAGNADQWNDVPGMVDVVHGDLGGHTTRLDIAFDDKVGLLDMDTVEAALRGGDYVSRWRNPPGFNGKVGQAVTWYLGSSRSDSQLVIYDKLQERLDQGHADQVEGLTHWIRVELRLRRERAQVAAEQLRQRGDQVWSYFAGVLRGLVDFKERGTSPQKTRWRTVSWWDRFLDGAAKAKLVVERKVRTLDGAKAYILGQVAPTLAVLERGMGKVNAWAFLLDAAAEGHDRLGPRHELLLQAVGAGTGG